MDRYERSDGWLLMTLDMVRGKMKRSSIIKCGDFLNRARFNDEEIDQGIERLERGGLARHQDGNYWITWKGKWFLFRNGGWNLRQGEIDHMIQVMDVMDGMKIQ
jgi:hypothetical protein